MTVTTAPGPPVPGHAVPGRGARVSVSNFLRTAVTAVRGQARSCATSSRSCAPRCPRWPSTGVRRANLNEGFSAGEEAARDPPARAARPQDGDLTRPTRAGHRRAQGVAAERAGDPTEPATGRCLATVHCPESAYVKPDFDVQAESSRPGSPSWVEQLELEDLVPLLLPPRSPRSGCARNAGFDARADMRRAVLDEVAGSFGAAPDRGDRGGAGARHRHAGTSTGSQARNRPFRARLSTVMASTSQAVSVRMPPVTGYLWGGRRIA